MNPLLPLYEYVPDGEPHVFGDRIYIFGSHDKEGGSRYCEIGNYVGWSAPVDDLNDWRYEGIIYEAIQDPDFDPAEGNLNDLYAPDVVRGNDGRYYMFYCMEHGEKSGLWGAISVAVCDTPAGKYKYHGTLRNPDGSRFLRYLPGDPGVINDDGIIRMYYGWSLSLVAAAAHNQGGEVDHSAKNMKHEELYQVEQMLFKRSLEELQAEPLCIMGANTVVIDEDMLTVSAEPKRIVPGQFQALGSGFEGHAFYEASAVTKINDRYYFIYSSQESHELCYAVSKYPDRDFSFGGTIIALGDVGLDGRSDDDRLNMTANNHGNLECINGQWYIFYHRQTHNSTFSRQACCEPVTIAADGSIAQVSVTTSGWERKNSAKGTVSAARACIITNGHMPHATNTVVGADIPYITHGPAAVNPAEAASEETVRYITGIKNHTLIGFKYFEFEGDTAVTLTLRGTANGKFIAAVDADARDGKISYEALASAETCPSDEWTKVILRFNVNGVHPLYLIYEGEGEAELLEIKF